MEEQGALATVVLHLATEEGTIYNNGNLANYLNQREKAAKPDHCIITMFEYENDHYLQLHGAFYAGEELLYLDAAYIEREVQQSTFYKVFAVLVIICILLSYFIAWLLTIPLLRLSTASRELAKGNLSYRAREQGGVGLGLTLCAKIAELHGGELYFDSQKEHGTCITADLRGERS